MQCAACQPHRVVGKYFRRRLNVSDTEFLYVAKDDSYSTAIFVLPTATGKPDFPEEKEKDAEPKPLS